MSRWSDEKNQPTNYNTKTRQQSKLANVAQIIAFGTIEDVTNCVIDYNDFLLFKAAEQPISPIDVIT